ncbi:MAG: hypothetical protein MJ250_03695 [Alphaproteobacteria bacterium]|nr:hypothetical protein [Alphaproteobacteria bacterium]
MKKIILSVCALALILFLFMGKKMERQGITKHLPTDYKQFVIGHRGARPMVPENTLSAFKYAKEHGVKMVELDVMLTADKIPVVFHDETLKRMARNPARIDELTFEELQKIELPAGERVPSFDAVVKLLKELDLSVNVEIKPSKPEFAKITAQKAWECIKANDFADHVFVSSFEWDSLFEFKKLAPSIKRGVLVEDVSPDWRETAKKLEAFSINYDANLLTPALIEEIHSLGYKILVWTVNDKKVANTLFEQGIFAIFSDEPDILGE